MTTFLSVTVCVLCVAAGSLHEPYRAHLSASGVVMSWPGTWSWSPVLNEAVEMQLISPSERHESAVDVGREGRKRSGDELGK